MAEIKTTKMPPSLMELMARHLERNANLGLSEVILPEGGEVIPHEARLGIRVDSLQAWEAAAAAATGFGLTQLKKPSTDWVRFSPSAPGMMALPFALGLFPQMVTPLDRLIDHRLGQPIAENVERAADTIVEKLRQRAAEPALTDVEFALAVNCLRFVGAFDIAIALLQGRIAKANTEFLQNELATTLWLQGNHEQALSIWQSLSNNAVTLFNRGMALLFLGKVEAGQLNLQQAMDLLQEDNPWFHLAGLYLTIE